MPYSILPRCGDEAELTATASHEILEASTNPDPAARGFAFVPDDTSVAFAASGVEAVDPCGLLTMDDHWTQASGFVVQRAWSNRAAALGQNPCVPARAGRPFVALVPRLPAVRLVRGRQRRDDHARRRGRRRGPRVGRLGVRSDRLPGARAATSTSRSTARPSLPATPPG